MANTGYFNNMGYGNIGYGNINMGYGYGNGSYNYNNGNFSSQTVMANGLSYTRNVVMMGSCGNSTNICNDGYSIYVPCIKNIMRGQDVCFDFYIGDNALQDEADLRDIDGLTLELSGVFGCSYGTFSYPDDIKSLQEDMFQFNNEYDFGSERYIVNLELYGEDLEMNDVDVNIKGEYGKYYIGDTVVLEAGDTETHIFVGWFNNTLAFDDECRGLTYENVELNTDRRYEFKIYEDTTVVAVYRERKKYRIKIDPKNKHSYYEVKYKGETHKLIFENDYVDVLENYHVEVTCCPHMVDDVCSYNFLAWNDNYVYRNREYCITDDLIKKNVIFKEDNKNIYCIYLLAMCVKDGVNNNNNFKDYTPIIDYIEINYPTEHVLIENIEIDYTADENVSEYKNIICVYKGSECYGMFKDGYIKFTNIDITDGIKVILNIKNNFDVPYMIYVKIGEEIQEMELNNSDFQEIEFYFSKCNNTDIEIYSKGICYIDRVKIMKEIHNSKGLMQLCIPGEITAKFIPGILNISGAISVGEHIYGLNSTQVGIVNKLKQINIL